MTTCPPQTTGTLTSPGPSLYGPSGVTAFAKTGKGLFLMSSKSLTAPFTTNPPKFLSCAYANIIPPTKALSVYPAPSTTIMSPGFA